jgi:hypothetical protein
VNNRKKRALLTSLQSSIRKPKTKQGKLQGRQVLGGPSSCKRVSTVENK